MPAWVEQGVDEYARRLPREYHFGFREIPLARRGGDRTPEQLCVLEGEQLLKALAPGDRVIALDVVGKSWSTEKLSEHLRNWQMSGDNVSFLIGGPDGLSDDALQAADQRWSLSDLTLPHPLVRILLAEQLYRAWTITVNHPYHRE
jgi:23S rRNA (pseudouridine1915-N3)-methyltransferase